MSRIFSALARAPLAMRSVDSAVSLAKKRGEHVGIYAESLFDVTVPWSRERTQLVRLCDKCGERRLDETCRRALAFDAIDVPRIARMLKSAVKTEDAGEREGRVIVLSKTRFAARHQGLLDDVVAAFGW